MESNDLNKKQIKNNKLLFLKKIALGSFYILAFIYLIDSIKIKIKKNKNLLRTLSENIREKGANENCIEFYGSYLYDLFKLADLKEEQIHLGSGIEFKFCKNLENKDSSCIYNKKTRLSGSIEGEDNNKNKIEITKTEKDQIINMYLAAGDKCDLDSSKRYTIDIQLICSNEKEFELIDKNFDPSTSCNLNFKAYTKYACGEDKYGDISGWAGIISGIFLVILGLLIGILGYMEIEIGLFIVCIVGTSILGYFIITFFEPFALKAVHIIVEVIFIGCGIGIFVYFHRKKKPFYSRIYMVIIGPLCGYPIGILLYNLFFAFINTSYQQLIHTIVIIVFIVIGVVLGIVIPKYTCIIGSSILGAYLIMRGISCFLAEKIEYIDEYKLYDLARTGNYKKIVEMIFSLFLIYPAILIVLVIILIIIQIKINPNWKEWSYKDLDDKMDKPKKISTLSFLRDAEEGDTPEKKDTDE